MSPRSKKSSLFLIELILVILFFAISAAVSMKIFAAARTAEVRASELTGASIAAQNTAELYKANGGDVEKTAAALGTKAQGGGFTVNYDGEWKKSDGGGYVLRLSAEGTRARISVSRGDKELFSVNAVSEVPQ